MDNLQRLSIISLIIAAVTISQLECSSNSGRYRTSDWNNYRARQNSFRPWHNRPTNTRPSHVRTWQRSGDDSSNDYSDYSDDSSNSGRRRVNPLTTYHNGGPVFAGRPPRRNDNIVQPQPDPFYQNNIQPPTQPNPFYQNNVQPQPQPDPFYQNNVQPPTQPNPFYQNNVQPQPQPDPFYENNVQPKPQPDPVVQRNPFFETFVPPQPPVRTILRSDIPETYIGPIVQRHPNPISISSAQPVGDPHAFYENNDPKPVIPSTGTPILVPTDQGELLVMNPVNPPHSPRIFVVKSDPIAFYTNNDTPNTVTSNNQPLPSKPDPVLYPGNTPFIIDRPLFAAGEEPDPIYTPLNGSSKPDVVEHLTHIPTPPAETTPPEIAVLTRNENLYDEKPPVGIKTDIIHNDRNYPEEVRSVGVREPIIYNDRGTPLDENPMTTNIDNIEYNDRPIPNNEPVIVEENNPNTVTENIPYNDRPIIDTTQPIFEEELLPTVVKTPIIYDDGGVRRTIPDEQPPSTSKDPIVYNDLPEKEEPDINAGRWEITPCFSGALVCPASCAASTMIGGKRYCCPGCTDYKIQVEGVNCRCLKKVDIIPGVGGFDDLHPDIVNKLPDRGDVAYWSPSSSRGTSNNNPDESTEPLISETARLLSNENSDNNNNNNNEVQPNQNQFERDPELDEQILSSVFGTPASTPTETQENKVNLDDFLKSVYSNGNPFDNTQIGLH